MKYQPSKKQLRCVGEDAFFSGLNFFKGQLERLVFCFSGLKFGGWELIMSRWSTKQFVWVHVREG